MIIFAVLYTFVAVFTLSVAGMELASTLDFSYAGIQAERRRYLRIMAFSWAWPVLLMIWVSNFVRDELE